MTESVKNWIFLALAAVFVLFYGAVLVGVIQPKADITVLARIEPIAFLVIGYFLARGPSAVTEKYRALISKNELPK